MKKHAQAKLRIPPERIGAAIARDIARSLRSSERAGHLITPNPAQSLGAGLEHLVRDHPAAATATALSLFLGLSLAELALFLHNNEQNTASKWDRARTALRRLLDRQDGDVELPEQMRPDPRTRTFAHLPGVRAFAVLARNPRTGILVASPVGPEQEADRRLAAALAQALERTPGERPELLKRLRDYSCLLAARDANETQLQEDLELLIHHMTQEHPERFGFIYRGEKLKYVDLTIVDLGGSSEKVERVFKALTKEQLDRISSGGESFPGLPRAELTLQEIEGVLASASSADSTTTLLGFESRVQALHLDRFVPALQRYLDQVQLEVAEIPGGNFGSFEKNKAFVDALRATLDRLGVRLECPTCGRPAGLIVRLGSTTTGSFKFYHASAGLRTEHGGKTSLPPMKLLPKTTKP